MLIVLANLLASGGQMSLGFVFWFLMLLWLILGLVWYWPKGTPQTGWPHLSGHMLVFLLLFLLGLKVFGFPIGG